MDYYQNQNGPIPPYPNPNSGMPPYYAPPTRHPGSGFATAALVLGILSIVTALVGTVYPPIICSGLAVLLALLSRGSDRFLLPNAKVGLITAVSGFVVNLLVVGSTILMLFTNPQLQEQFHRQLNQYYEAFYGESFDDAWEQIREGMSGEGQTP